MPPPTVGLPAHICYETFEDPKHTTATGTGDDWEAGRDLSFAMSGNYGFRLRTKASSPATEDFVENGLFFPLLPANVLDASTDFLVRGETHDYYVYLITGSPFDSKTNYWVGQAQIRVDTGGISVIDETETERVLATLGDLTTRRFIHFETIMDLKAKKWKGIRIGNYYMDASAYGLCEQSGFIGYNYSKIVVSNVSTNRAFAHFDNLTLKGHIA